MGSAFRLQTGSRGAAALGASSRSRRLPTRKLARCLPTIAWLPFITPTQVLALSACSRGWRELCGDDALWRALAARDHPTLLRTAAAVAASGRPWRAAYEHAHRLQSLRHVGWEQVEQQPVAVQGRWPRDREGHAACPWGRSGMLVCGGFGGGTLGDLHLLLPTPPAGPSSSSGGGGRTSTRGGGGVSAGGGGSSGSGGYRWLQPKAFGRPPIGRYGHSLTRCGPRGELAVLFGGLMAGGYQAPLDTIAVLRRRRAPAAGSEAADAADAGVGSEEQTSLGLRLPEGQPQHEMLWAQVGAACLPAGASSAAACHLPCCCC